MQQKKKYKMHRASEFYLNEVRFTSKTINSKKIYKRNSRSNKKGND